jgi:hypothetical protein
MESMYGETVLTRRAETLFMSFEEFVQTFLHIANYKTYLEVSKSSIPGVKLNARIYERDFDPTWNSITDFEKVVGLPLGFLKPFPRDNPSIIAEAIEAAKIVLRTECYVGHTCKFGYHIYNANTWRLRLWLVERYAGTCHFFTEETARKTLDACRESNTAVAETCFGRQRLFSDDLSRYAKVKPMSQERVAEIADDIRQNFQFNL